MSKISYIPVSKAQHKGFGYVPVKGMSFIDAWPFIPVASNEIARLIGVFPLIFQRTKKGYQLGVLTGLEDNFLLHPATKQFLLPYIPATLRHYPFAALKTEQGDTILSVVSSETGFSLDQGDAILDETGVLTERGQELMQFLQQLNACFERDRILTDQLEKNRLFRPLQLKDLGVPEDEASDEAKACLKGYYLLSEQRFNALDAKALLALRDTGVFSFFYGHLFSLAMMDRFLMLKEASRQLREASDSKKEGLDAFFKDGDDALKFD
ncbi:MAG: SapC family protein [Thiomicrorhabdus sp.]|nr:SapC family protein [Thiomicrorhabdus sp.]